jgi:hypothetical protein
MAQLRLAPTREVVVHGHADDHVVERPRHERHDFGVVVVEVVAPAERVVDAASVGCPEVALEVAELAAEEVDV